MPGYVVKTSVTHLDLFLCWNLLTLELTRPVECRQSVILELRDRFDHFFFFEAGGRGGGVGWAVKKKKLFLHR